MPHVVMTYDRDVLEDKDKKRDLDDLIARLPQIVVEAFNSLAGVVGRLELDDIRLQDEERKGLAPASRYNVDVTVTAKETDDRTPYLKLYPKAITKALAQFDWLGDLNIKTVVRLVPTATSEVKLHPPKVVRLGLTNLIDEAIRLREKIFITEKGRLRPQERDAIDNAAEHFAVVRNSEIVATLRLWQTDIREGFYQIDRVAVRHDMRDRGFGKKLMEFAQDQYTPPARRFEVNAALDDEEFYAKLGYTRVGAEFEAYGAPHVRMNFDVPA